MRHTARLRAMLRSRDEAQIRQAVDLVASLQDGALIDALLRGVELEEGASNLNGVQYQGFTLNATLKAPLHLQHVTQHALLSLLSLALPGSASAALRDRVRALHLMGLFPYRRTRKTAGDPDTAPIDLGPLAAFSALTHLLVQHAEPVTGLGALAEVPLEHLHLSHSLTDAELAAFQRFDRLKVLWLGSGAALTALDPLAGCAALEKLTLNRYDSALGPLGALPALTELSLGWSHAADLSALRGHGALRQLSLHTTQTRLDTVAELPALRALNLSTMREVRSLEGMVGLPALEQVLLYNLQGLEDTTALAEMPGLKAVSAMGCPRADWSWHTARPDITLMVR